MPLLYWNKEIYKTSTTDLGFQDKVIMVY